MEEDKPIVEVFSESEDNSRLIMETMPEPEIIYAEPTIVEGVKNNE